VIVGGDAPEVPFLANLPLRGEASKNASGGFVSYSGLSQKVNKTLYIYLIDNKHVRIFGCFCCFAEMGGVRGAKTDKTPPTYFENGQDVY
jgi:hypothetical protein